MNTDQTTLRKDRLRPLLGVSLAIGLGIAGCSSFGPVEDQAPDSVMAGPSAPPVAPAAAGKPVNERTTPRKARRTRDLAGKRTPWMAARIPTAPGGAAQALSASSASTPSTPSTATAARQSVAAATAGAPSVAAFDDAGESDDTMASGAGGVDPSDLATDPRFADQRDHSQPTPAMLTEPLFASANRPYRVRGRSYRPMTSRTAFAQRGTASWYGPRFHGKLTAIGERYDQHAFTAAHPTLPLPSYVQVTNLSNGKTVVVRVNDRGPYAHNRIIDLSHGAATRLGIVHGGLGQVELKLLTAPTNVAGESPATHRGADRS